MSVRGRGRSRCLVRRDASTRRPSWLQQGLRLESEGFVLTYRPSGVVALGEDSDMGCWVSVTRIQPGEDYRVLAGEDHTSDVRAFLDAWDLDGVWHETSAAGAAPAVAGRCSPTWRSGLCRRPREIPPALSALVPSPRERLTSPRRPRAESGSRDLPTGRRARRLAPKPCWKRKRSSSGGRRRSTAVPGQRVELRNARASARYLRGLGGAWRAACFTTVSTLGSLQGEGTGTLGFPVDVDGGAPRAAAAGRAPELATPHRPSVDYRRVHRR